MIRKLVYSPILFFLLPLLVSSCSNAIKKDTKNYKTAIDKGDEFFDKKVNLDSAFYYYNLAKEYSTDKSGEDHTYALLQIATVQQYVGDYFGSEESITQALANYNGTVYKPYLYNVLAVAYDKQRKFDDALQYYKKAYSSFDDSTAKILAENNIGLIYQKKNQHEKAVQVFKPLLKRHNRKIDIALILGNLGYSQFKLNRPEAYSNLLKSLQLTINLEDVIGNITANIHLSEFFRDNDKIKSKHFALNALNASKSINSPDEQLESLKWLIESSVGMDAKAYSIEFIKLNDSINLSRGSAKNQFAKIKYDSRKAIEEKQIVVKQNKTVSIAFVLVVIGVIILFFFIRYLNYKKLINSVYATETRIAKKIHDELANDVFKAMNYAENQDLQNPDKKEILLQNLDDLYTRTRNISQTNSEIETGEDYKDFLIQLLNSFSNENVNVIINNSTSIDWLKLKKEIKIAVYRVLQELMVNMKKHSESSVVIISFENHTKYIQIKYSDNGKGIVQLENHKKGLHNAENRIHAIKGTITFETESDKGFKTKIIIPK